MAPAILLASTWRLAESVGLGGLYGDWSVEWDAVFDVMSGLFVGSLVVMILSFFVLPVAWWLMARGLRGGKLLIAATVVAPPSTVVFLWIDPFGIASWWFD